MRKVAATIILLPFVFAIAQAGPNDTVYKTKTGEKYHLEKCSSLRKSKIKTTVKEAKESGLGACKRCHPPVAIKHSQLRAA